MSKTLKIGDVVFSKKYNCKVTVREIVDDGIICNWFDFDDLKYGNLNREKLLINEIS